MAYSHALIIKQITIRQTAIKYTKKTIVTRTVNLALLLSELFYDGYKLQNYTHYKSSFDIFVLKYQNLEIFL